MADLNLEINTHIRAHLANERTFLAWLRTSIAIMAFGFVVQKFSIFLHQLQRLASNVPQPVPLSPTPGYSAYLGIALVIIGELTCVLAFFKFRETKIQIAQGSYRPSALLDVMLTLAITLIGISLVIYLLDSII